MDFSHHSENIDSKCLRLECEMIFVFKMFDIWFAAYATGIDPFPF